MTTTMTLDQLVEVYSQISCEDMARLRALPLLSGSFIVSCTQKPFGGFTDWDGASLFTKAAQWGQNQGYVTAFPTFTGRDGKNEVIAIKNLDGQDPGAAYTTKQSVLDLGGYCSSILTDPDDCGVACPTVWDYFANIAKFFVSGNIIGAIPTLLWPSFYEVEVAVFPGSYANHSIVGASEVDNMDPRTDPATFIEKVVQVGKRRGFVAAYPDFVSGRLPTGGFIFGVTQLTDKIAESQLVNL